MCLYGQYNSTCYARGLLMDHSQFNYPYTLPFIALKAILTLARQVIPSFR